MTKFTIIHIDTNLTTHCDTIEAEDRQSAESAAQYRFSGNDIVAIVETADPAFVFLRGLLNDFWPHIRMFPICGCDRSLLRSVAVVAAILGEDTIATAATDAGNAGEIDGMRKVLGWLANHPVWGTKMSSRLHGQLVAEMEKFVSESEGNGGG